jgi:hypothetical protein
VIQAGDGDVSKHNAVAILANPDLAGDDPADELLLNNTPENDGEYNSCPNQLYLDHFVDGFDNPVIDPTPASRSIRSLRRRPVPDSHVPDPRALHAGLRESGPRERSPSSS